MKALDVINRLKQVVPRHTGLFCDEINVYTLSFSGGIVTCTCAVAHELTEGEEIFISGALTPITINSITRVGSLATAITNSNHDLTRGYQENVTINGAHQTEYNGEHPLIDVLNRKTFVFSVSGTPTTPCTGSPMMIEDIKAGYNGLHTVLSVIDSRTFTYAITSAPESPAQGTIVLRKGLAITGDVTMDRFLYSYSKQPENKFWMVVIMGGASTSKDRFTLSDALSTSTVSSVEARLRIIDPFSIFVVAPSSDTLTAMTIRDGMGYVLNVINKGILFYRFPTETAIESPLGVSLLGHGMYQYDIARYIHEFRYEFVYDLIRDDGVDDADTSVAFRDIDLHFNSFLNAKHNELMRTLVDLDDQPLP
jgi:hypothetical protein